MLVVKETPASTTRFQWLRTVDESMESMLAAIQTARQSVRLEMYIYSASTIGERFRDALVAAASRGLRVQVMLDAWGSVTLSDKFWMGLRDRGGEVLWFNPLRLGCYGIRDHRKLLVCDETVAFVGGFNISSEYQGDGVTRGWFDLGLRIEGYLAEELAASFDAMFAVADFRQGRFSGFRARVSQKLISTYQGGLILAGPGHSPNLLKPILLKDIRNAKCLQVIAAYFLPPRPIRRALLRAARRGTQLQIILGAKSDVPLLQLAFRRFYQAFMRAGIELYEYQPQIMHAKLIIADDIVYAGSANLDRRSFLANYELMVRVTSSPLAAEARDIFQSTLAHCRRIEPKSWKRSRSFLGKLKEWWAFFLLARLDACVSRKQLRSLR
jgi:cardiolipin synthase